MLLAMVKHARHGQYTVADLQDARKLRLGLLLLYQARIGQKNLIESTSIHINYDKLPAMDSTNKKLGKTLDLDSELLVSGFSKLKDMGNPSGKPKQKIVGKSLREKKLKSSAKQPVTEDGDGETIEPIAADTPDSVAADHDAMDEEDQQDENVRSMSEPQSEHESPAADDDNGDGGFHAKRPNNKSKVEDSNFDQRIEEKLPGEKVTGIHFCHMSWR